MLPLPRPRPDVEQVRRGLARLAGLHLDPAAEVPGHPRADDLLLAPDDGPVVLGDPRRLRPVVVAVLLTALATWLLLHVTAGGSPSPVQLVPGTPLAVGATSAPAPTPTVPAAGSASGASSSTADATPAPEVVVQVVGQVVHPGLVTLPAGSRVADAVRAAGGLRARGSSGGLNLARVLVDGEQVVVSPDATPDAAAPAAGPGAPSVVNLNSATVADLDTLPGVGPVMAARILDWRAAHGRFTSVDQLREVSGVGARTFERLKPHVRV